MRPCERPPHEARYLMPVPGTCQEHGRSSASAYVQSIFALMSTAFLSGYRRVAQLEEHLPTRAEVPTEVPGTPATRSWRSRGHTQGVGGSSPSSPTIFITRDAVGLVECPYLHRWVLSTPWFSIRLHLWEESDDVRYFHDHPWWYWSWVLRGSYLNASPEGVDVVRAGSLRYRPAGHRHSVVVLVRGTTTILITGPARRRWGFWVNGRLVKRDRYFAVYGHHPCVAGAAPVRLRPDGSRIA